MTLHFIILLFWISTKLYSKNLSSPNFVIWSLKLVLASGNGPDISTMLLSMIAHLLSMEVKDPLKPIWIEVVVFELDTIQICIRYFYTHFCSLSNKLNSKLTCKILHCILRTVVCNKIIKTQYITVGGIAHICFKQRF